MKHSLFVLIRAFSRFIFRRVPVCAECAKNFTPGPGDICLKCDKINENVAMCLMLVFLLGCTILAISVIMYLLQVVEELTTEDGVNLNGKGTCSFAQRVMASLPLSSTKILLVASQIVAQVSAEIHENLQQIRVHHWKTYIVMFECLRTRVNVALDTSLHASDVYWPSLFFQSYCSIYVGPIAIKAMKRPDEARFVLHNAYKDLITLRTHIYIYTYFKYVHLC